MFCSAELTIQHPRCRILIVNKPAFIFPPAPSPFPFPDFAMNQDLRIVQAGPALRKACPQLSADGIHVDQALHVRGG